MLKGVSPFKTPMKDGYWGFKGSPLTV